MFDLSLGSLLSRNSVFHKITTAMSLHVFRVFSLIIDQGFFRLAYRALVTHSPVSAYCGRTTPAARHPAPQPSPLPAPAALSRVAGLIATREIGPQPDPPAAQVSP